MSDSPQPQPSEVELLRWPADAVRREELRVLRVPRLLLVEDGVAPPLLDVDEDWIRVPTDERDLWARLQRLALQHQQRRRLPTLRDDVVLDYQGQTVVVSEGEGQVLRLLLAHFGQVVPWDQLLAELWPDGSGTSKLGNARVSRLRIRIAQVGLVVHNLRSRGVMLDHGEPQDPDEEASWRTW